MLYTPQRQRVIQVYEKLSQTKVVRPSYRLVAKVAHVALGTAFKTIKTYLAEQKGSKWPYLNC